MIPAWAASCRHWRGIVKQAQQLFGVGGDNRMGDEENGQTMSGDQGPVAPSENVYASQGRPRAPLPTSASGPVSGRPTAR